MATFKEIAEEYADQIRTAIREDSREKKAYITKSLEFETPDADEVAEARVTSVLKKISRELQTRWKIKEKPLSEEDRKEILRFTGTALGLPDPDDFSVIAKSASNDAYMQLVQHIGGLVNVVKK